MINFKRVNKYCRDDISLIENYLQALNATDIYDGNRFKIIKR